jgi:hypothetical protein
VSIIFSSGGFTPAFNAGYGIGGGGVSVWCYCGDH